MFINSLAPAGQISLYMSLRVLTVLSLCALLLTLSSSFNVQSRRWPRVHLSAVDDDDKQDMKGLPGMKGYYRRPSRAIEKGGGFFVPGLEGERIRILTSIALFAMFSLNRAGQVMQTLPQIISEVTGLIMAFVLFLQGVAELFPSRQVPIELMKNTDGDLSTTYLVTRQILDDTSRENVEYIARSILQTCSGLAYVVALNESGDVMVEVGPVGQGATTMTPQEGSLLASIAQQTTTDGIDKESFISTVVTAANTETAREEVLAACMPSAVRGVALRRGYAGTTWLVASTIDDSGLALRDQIKWIDSLVQSPFK